MKTHLDLCSGIGGFALAAHWAGYRTIGFVEIDPWCRRVLAKNFPGVPMHDDVTTLAGRTVRGWIDSVLADTTGNDGVTEPTERRQETDGRRKTETVGGRSRQGEIDLITGGYPCQPFSVAGKRLGEEDDRHLWPAIAALVAELQPAQCLFENVAGHITLGIDRVLADLEALGYACGTVVVPACAVNAPHRRDRIWLMAHADRHGRREHLRTDTPQGPFSQTIWREGAPGTGPGGTDVAHAEREQPEQPQGIRDGGRGWLADGGTPRRGDSRTNGHGAGEVVANADDTGRREQRRSIAGDAEHTPAQLSDWWAVEPELGRVAHGVPNRSHRLRALGNAIVPQVAYEIIEAMKAA